MKPCGWISVNKETGVSKLLTEREEITDLALFDEEAIIQLHNLWCDSVETKTFRQFVMEMAHGRAC